MSKDVEVTDMSFKLSQEGNNTKYKFDTIQAGFGFKIPDDVKTSTMRVIVSRWHTDNKTSGKKFRVYASDRTVVRIK